MHIARSGAYVAFLSLVAAGAAHLVACGDDDPVAPPADTSDAAVEPDASAPVVGPTLTISSTRAKIYLGQTAKLDGASIAPDIVAKHAWTVVAAPSGSSVGNEAIQDATTPSPTIKPDKLGLFTLQVSGETKDGASASVLVHLEALDAPVFFVEGRITIDHTGNGAVRLSTHVAGAWGSQAREVGCPRTLEIVDSDTGAPITAAASSRGGGSNGDTWEGPPGTPARVVFPWYDIRTGAPTFFSSSLVVATSEDGCGAEGPKVIASTEHFDGGVTVLENLIYGARFSPNGERIAYIHDRVGVGARLATVGFDGSDPRDLTPTHADGDGGLIPDGGTNSTLVGSLVVGPVAPRWKDDTHVGWISFTSAPPSRVDWELWTVEDKASAVPELVMRCTNAEITHFDFLPDGTIVAAVRHEHTLEDGGSTKPMDIVVYRADATTKACEVVRNLTNNTENTHVARDFALSPDKTTVAFYGGVGNGQPGTSPNTNTARLYTVPVDGSRPPTPVPGATGNADLGSGPRWAAGGTVLVWSQIDMTPYESGGGSSLVRFSRLVSVPAGGGDVAIVTSSSTSHDLQTDGGAQREYVIRHGIGQGCGVAPATISNGIVLFSSALGLVGLLVRRRRTRSG